MNELKNEDPTIAEAALKRALADEYRNSLFAVAKHLCGYKDVNEATHGGMIRCLEDLETKRKLICVPRGCLKTSISCVAYPIWRLINDPNLRILIDGELYTNSRNVLREMRAHLESRRFVELFGEFKSDTWNEGEIIVRQRSKAYREASVSAGGIGTTKVGLHFDIIIGDDMNSPKNSNTPEAAQNVINHYKYALSILEPQGEYVIIGTRYSESDLIGHILANELGIQDTPTSGVYETV